MDQPYRHFWAWVRNALRLCVPALLVVGVLTAAASVPASARTPKIKKPGAPAAVTINAVNGGAAVSWSPPASDGGSPIIGYTVTVTHSSQACTTTDVFTCILTGLTNGRRYQIKVQASNVVGPGRIARDHVTPSSAQNCSYIGPYANLQSCNLQFDNLTSYNLTDANLTDTGFSGVDLLGATLTGANVTGADLGSAITLARVLSGDITGAPSTLPTDWTLIDGYLIGPGANLAGADFNGVDLSGVDLLDVSSGGITGTPEALPPGWTLIGGYLFGANAYLAQAQLSSYDLSGIDLSYDYLYEANLTSTTLTDANLTGAILTNAEVTDATLTGVTWSNTTCPDGTNSDSDGDTCVNNLG
jgi:uncharacterized protein YjbI with pentapeptide repeats